MESGTIKVVETKPELKRDVTFIRGTFQQDNHVSRCEEIGLVDFHVETRFGCHPYVDIVDRDLSRTEEKR